MTQQLKKSWHDIDPKDAVDLNLSKRLDITAPLNEQGERCAWPWEPQQLIGVPLGQFHCGYCGAMVVAGMPHLDYKDFDTDIEDALLHVKFDGNGVDDGLG